MPNSHEDSEASSDEPTTVAPLCCKHNIELGEKLGEFLLIKSEYQSSNEYYYWSTQVMCYHVWGSNQSLLHLHHKVRLIYTELGILETIKLYQLKT